MAKIAGLRHLFEFRRESLHNAKIIGIHSITINYGKIVKNFDQSKFLPAIFEINQPSTTRLRQK